MKKIVAATVLALFGLAPGVGAACEYNDASMASADPPAQLGLAPAPQASKAPAPVVAKAPAVKTVKQVSDKDKAPARDTKVAAATSTN